MPGIKQRRVGEVHVNLEHLGVVLRLAGGSQDGPLGILDGRRIGFPQMRLLRTGKAFLMNHCSGHTHRDAQIVTRFRTAENALLGWNSATHGHGEHFAAVARPAQADHTKGLPFAEHE